MEAHRSILGSSFLVIGLVLVGCGGDDKKTGGASSGIARCDFCASYGATCDWDADDIEDCRADCEERMPHVSSCQGAFDAALGCFADESKWDCRHGPVGCAALIETYDDCREGVWTRDSLLPQALTSIVAHPEQPATLYLAGESLSSYAPAVYRSQDAGATFSYRGTLDIARGSSMVLAAGSGEVLYGAQGSSVLRSDDGGASFTTISSQNLHPSFDIFHLCLGTADGAVLYALIDEGGFYRSENGGVDWVKSNAGLPSTQINDDAFCAEYPELCVDNDMVYVQALAIDPSDDHVLYLGTGRFQYSDTGRGVFKSTDRGASWSRVGTGMPNITVVALQAVTSQLIYALGEDASLYRSDDAGETWRVLTVEDSYIMAVDLAVDPSAPDRVYVLASTWSAEVYTLSGSHWSRVISQGDGGDPSSYGTMSMQMVFGSTPAFVLAGPDGLWRYVGGFSY